MLWFSWFDLDWELTKFIFYQNSIRQMESIDVCLLYYFVYVKWKRVKIISTKYPEHTHTHIGTHMYDDIYYIIHSAEKKSSIKHQSFIADSICEQNI